MGIVKFGTLLLDGQPYVGCVKKGGAAKLSFGYTDPNTAVEWVETGNLLVARHLVCMCISWDALNAQNLVTGRLMLIDGQYFMCRCPSEQDAIYGEPDNVWVDWDLYFWCQEEHFSNPTFRVLRKMSQKKSAYGTKDAAVSLIGFRPVLEPVKCVKDQDLSHTLHGSVKLWFPFGPVKGTLTDYSDYDITIRTEQRLPEANSTVCRNDDEIVISRTGHIWMTNNRI